MLVQDFTKQKFWIVFPWWRHKLNVKDEQRNVEARNPECRTPLLCIILGQLPLLSCPPVPPPLPSCPSQLLSGATLPPMLVAPANRKLHCNHCNWSHFIFPLPCNENLIFFALLWYTGCNNFRVISLWLNCIYLRCKCKHCITICAVLLDTSTWKRISNTLTLSKFTPTWICDSLMLRWVALLQCIGRTNK